MVERSDTTGTRHPPHDPRTPARGNRTNGKRSRKDAKAQRIDSKSKGHTSPGHPSVGRVPPRGASHRQKRFQEHPGGMPDGSRWLSEATPPEPVPPTIHAPRPGVPERVENGLAKTPRREGSTPNQKATRPIAIHLWAACPHASHRQERFQEHPGGMPDGSRWLSEATPPEPAPPRSTHPGEGCQNEWKTVSQRRQGAKDRIQTKRPHPTNRTASRHVEPSPGGPRHTTEFQLNYATCCMERVDPMAPQLLGDQVRNQGVTNTF